MALGGRFKSLDKTGLRRRLLLLFIALAAPMGVLVWQALAEVKWEAFHRHRLMAEELAIRIDDSYTRLIGIEEQRPFTDFAFLNVIGSADANLLQRSALATYPVESPVPGAIGYFQVDADGRFSTPYLPEESAQAQRYGISQVELDQRIALVLRIRGVLAENRLVAGSPTTRRELEETARNAMDGDNAASETRVTRGRLQRYEAEQSMPGGEVVPPQAAFDQLKSVTPRKQKRSAAAAMSGIERLEDLRLAEPFAEPRQESAQIADGAAPERSAAKAKVRKELGQLPLVAPEGEMQDSPRWPSRVPVTTFESELDRYQFSRLDERHFVLFRNVWREGQRFVQGLLVQGAPFFQEQVGALFRPSLLASMSDLLLAHRGDVEHVFSVDEGYDYLSREEMRGALLYRTALAPPLDEIDLLFTVRRLPPGAGSSVIVSSAALLFLVLCGGLWAVYRLGLGQIALARQQQEFVSAVSHELKTPLTSIRMYGEMLMRGWVDDRRRATYYRYIFEEGERLSRLIENVLQFARMNRGQHRLVLGEYQVDALLDEIVPKLRAQTEQAGFALSIVCIEADRAVIVRVDKDALTQVLINLVDNAVKFAAGCERREVELGCRSLAGRGLRLWVRDYGPGIARDQRRKIFTMFYRSEDEMTRETGGTGIGLALAQRLVTAMHGSIEVADPEPGAEFRIMLPCG